MRRLGDIIFVGTQMTTPWVLSSRQCEIMVNNVVKQWETGDYAVHIAYTGVTTPPEGSDRLDSAPSISIAPSHSVKAVFSKVQLKPGRLLLRHLPTPWRFFIWKNFHHVTHFQTSATQWYPWFFSTMSRSLTRVEQKCTFLVLAQSWLVQRNAEV